MGESAVLAASSGVSAVAEFARPGDTNAYAALDVVADSTSTPSILVFAALGRRKGSYGLITKSQITTDQKTNTARFRLHLFTVAPTGINDNSPFLTLWVNRLTKVGSIDFTAAGTEDSTNSTSAGSLNTSTMLPFVCDSQDTALYGILETLDAFTPANAQNFSVKLTVEQG